MPRPPASSQNNENSPSPESFGSLFKQPRSVWALAVTSACAFMAIGLADPILPAIAAGLRTQAPQLSYLLSAYFLVSGIMMFAGAFVSSKLGLKKTLLLGLGLMGVFALLSGLSLDVAQLVSTRTGWGLGNALFVTASLAAMLGAASAGRLHAIVLYEAALGAGIAIGPILGALVSGWQWRAPFFGTAAAVFVGMIVLLVFKSPAVSPQPRISWAAMRHVLSQPAFMRVSFSGLFFQWTFFTVLTFAPFTLGLDAYGIGAVFCAWGLAILLGAAFFSPLLYRKWGASMTTTLSLWALGILLFFLALAMNYLHGAVLPLVVTSGLFLGINNAMYTKQALDAADAPESLAASVYLGLRWAGGGLAPLVALYLADAVGPSTPFALAAFLLIPAVFLLPGTKTSDANQDDPSQSNGENKTAS